VERGQVGSEPQRWWCVIRFQVLYMRRRRGVMGDESYAHCTMLPRGRQGVLASLMRMLAKWSENPFAAAKLLNGRDYSGFGPIGRKTAVLRPGVCAADRDLEQRKTRLEGVSQTHPASFLWSN
jgi:hypothetical protein